jgi:hypothetical protein
LQKTKTNAKDAKEGAKGAEESGSEPAFFVMLEVAFVLQIGTLNCFLSAWSWRKAMAGARALRGWGEYVRDAEVR